ncbi:MAG: hypothetical protein EOO68_32765, partial [Moraxellaceae bacterium]
MKFYNALFISLTIVICMAITACSSMDKIPETHIQYSPVWEYNPQAEGTITIEKDWWKAFGSPQLTELVERTQQKNPDVIIAGERVKQAELQMN